MKTNLFMAAVAICVMSTVALAQTGLAGKWQTAPAAPAAAAAPPAAAPPAGDPAAGGGGRGGGRGGRGGGGGGGGQVRLDLTIAAGKVTGSMFEGGADLVIMEGTATATQAKWHTIRQLNGADFRVNWTADLTPEGTISLTREFPGGVPGGGGGRGGGGGAPGGGAPPAAAGAAPAAPPAGAPPAGGGAPGGGGRGAGGGGGGRGGGAIAPVILVRAQ